MPSLFLNQLSMRAPMRVASAKSVGRVASHAQPRMPARSYQGRNERSNSCSRNFLSKSGNGMRTGQTTPHWLHIVDACGRSSAFSRPMYDGVRIEPIGPG